MKASIFFASVFLVASSALIPAQAQGIPGGIAHGAAVGSNTAGPVGAVVGGVVGGAIGGVEGLLGVDRHGYAQPTYRQAEVIQERRVIEPRRRVRARPRYARRFAQPRRVRHAEYRRARAGYRRGY